MNHGKIPEQKNGTPRKKSFSIPSFTPRRKSSAVPNMTPRRTSYDFQNMTPRPITPFCIYEVDENYGYEDELDFEKKVFRQIPCPTLAACGLN